MSRSYQKGYTLTEGIVALALLSVGMVAVFSFLGLAVEAQLNSEITLNEALEINSLCDELKYELDGVPEKNQIIVFLQSNYPDYRLVDLDKENNIWIIEIENERKPQNHFFVAYYGGEIEKKTARQQPD